MEEEKRYLSQEKYDELEKELQYLKQEKRKEIAENLEYAKSLGDLSENAEYHEAREAQANTEDRIKKLEDVLKNSEIVKERCKTDVVMIGCQVTVQRKGEDEAKTYTIVGSEESDMASGKISHDSPFGQAIMGKKKGDIFSYKSPKGEIEYKIISIS